MQPTPNKDTIPCPLVQLGCYHLNYCRNKQIAAGVLGSDLFCFTTKMGQMKYFHTGQDTYDSGPDSTMSRKEEKNLRPPP
jgi:hypothetical protein